MADDDSLIDMSVLAPGTDEDTLILSVADDGIGRLTSASEFRETARGGQGIANLDLRRSGGGEAKVAATFPVALADELMLVTDAGTMIRCPVEGIRIAGRATRGVRILDVAEGERVVSVTRLAEEGEASASGGGDEA
jgi:DNA gyrase subunit A